MQRLFSLALALAFGASLAMAGEPGGDRRGPGGRMGDRQRGMRGGPPPGLFGGPNTDIFDVAQRAATLTVEQRAAVEALATQFAAAEAEAVAEVRKRLNKEYLVQIVKLLPDGEKPKYEAAITAMTARDEAIAAATKTLRAVLDNVKAKQGADKAPAADDGRPPFFGLPRAAALTAKLDLLATHFVLSDGQKAMLDDVRRGAHEGMRDRMRDAMRGRMAALHQAGGRPDIDMFRTVRSTMQRVREQLDEENAKKAVEILNEKQKADFATASKAIDAFRKARDEAEATCRTQVVEAVGDDKANAILGPPPPAVPEPALPEKKTDF
ncbi:MAG: hypothetical protein ISS72_02875 [Candidatus Brocadiae bacterium]|nr:hypothetical protein [Candidatus Brocadiia bacterium]